MLDHRVRQSHNLFGEQQDHASYDDSNYPFRTDNL